MLDHHIQRSIITRLSIVDEQTFSELQPDEIDNKLFTYHLKVVAREGLVEKTAGGKYRLTSEGKKSWRRSSQKVASVSERARSILFLIIRDKAGRWLLYKRKTHPLKDKIGFMHIFPTHLETVLETAQNQSLNQTNLQCTFSVAGSGFFRLICESSLESFTNFTLLYSLDATGVLSPKDDSADYFWEERPDFTSADMLPNMKKLTDYYLAGEFPFFIDETVTLGS